MVPSSKILLGCIIGVLSSATQSIGLTLQRKSHVLEDYNHLNNSSYEYRQPYKRPLWRVGFTLFLIANLLGSSIQITTLPLIILSPLQAVGLVFNSICSAVILNESFTIYSVIGTVLVGFGALFIAAFGSISEPNHSLKELLELMKRYHFVIWIVLSNLFVIFILCWINIVKLIHRKVITVNHIPTLIRKSFDYPHIEKFKFLKGCCYGVISGILSAHSLLLAKSTVEIILNAISKKSFQNLQSIKCWIIVVCFFILAITQLVFLNKGLKNVSTSILYPLVFCVYNITNIINGLVFYNQLHVLSAIQFFMIILGTILVLLGVFALSWRLDETVDGTPHHRESIDSYNKDYLNERSSLLITSALDEDDVGYVSFGTPVKNDQNSMEETSEFRDSDSLGGSNHSPMTPFKYGTILESNSNVVINSVASKRRSQRLLSYEQSELLNQLKNLT